MEDWQNGGFGIYFHWPFCQSKCPYCDFNSHVSGSVDQDAWRDAYLSEIDRVAAETSGRLVQSIYFGGGTPSLMAPSLVAKILDRVRLRWSLTNDVEITLEANPSSVEIAKFRDFRSAGVNRVSLGVQSLRDDDLRMLGRMHSVSEAKTAIDVAQSVFERTSFDLIYARQNQDLMAWEAELAEGIALANGHLSLYQLTIEQGTAFGDRYNAGKLRGLPDDDLGADMYFLTQDMAAAAGLPAYEVSNHAKPGLESRHNQIYWRYGDYAGIGPGAHSRLTINTQKRAIDTPLGPTQWLDQVAQVGHGEKTRLTLSATEQATEYLMMGLRINDGVSLARIKSLHDDIFSHKIKNLQSDGLLEVNNSRLIVTDSGRPLINAIVKELLP
ncbi:radical SAM family heme chaperone HemW [Celeribacter marinus]|uniref:Heme chaperone HemW n=1 Tax=Celeribacter marinus TaxID=1397108 RepID=A0A0P0A580_9RHOB|nr:radical SAM family heme chaperone HemW [Celeribacter marinus]ALI55726.1 Radical SAM family enzyme, similar to coproporphyrinogen III oxidase [Celeribacter marinus]SFL04434.1 oxygen-independent coproporphyrinogen-3 oxidase [Celeribacter marinus]